MKMAIITLLALLPLAACRRSRPDSQAAGIDGLFATWDRKDTPGCAVGVSRDGSIVYEQGYGMANLELGVPITKDTVFAIASVTKTFTAMSVVLAAQQGKLSLDNEVQKYIPEWQDTHDHITIRHLLSHTSGLRDAFFLLGLAEPSESAGDLNEDIVRILARQRGVNFPPGSEYQYNNGGYALLAAILKRATGQSLREFADANIFKPLGMTHTLVHDNRAQLVPDSAARYSRNAEGWHAAPDDGAVVGNTGVYSTVGDLLLFENNFMDPRAGMFTEMEKSLGASAAQYRGLKMIGHTGGDRGIAANVEGYPDQRFAVAVLCNIDHSSVGGTTTVDPEAISNSIADIYLAGALGPVGTESAKVAPQSPVKLSDAELMEKTGLYRSVGKDLPARMTVDHGTLMIRSYYQDDVDFELKPVAANRFLLQNRVPFDFVPARDGQPKEWHYGQGPDQRVMQAVTFMPIETDLRVYPGLYRSEELGLTYALEARNSSLVVKNIGPDVLTPFSKDVFVGDGVGILKFTRDLRGAITGFTINRDLVRGVRFERVLQ